jgi:excisionase family DNA binding protein
MNTTTPTTNDPDVTQGLNTTGTPALLVTVEEAARLLACGRTFAYSLVLSGELPTIKLGRLRRIPVTELHRYIAGRTAA